MKSITMMPPMSRKRSWRMISRHASRFVLSVVSPRNRFPTKRPVLTSITVMASVWSITKWPPDGNSTRRVSALRASPSMPNASKSELLDTKCWTFSASSGATARR